MALVWWEKLDLKCSVIASSRSRSHQLWQIINITLSRRSWWRPIIIVVDGETKSSCVWAWLIASCGCSNLSGCLSVSASHRQQDAAAETAICTTTTAAGARGDAVASLRDCRPSTCSRLGRTTLFGFRPAKTASISRRDPHEWRLGARNADSRPSVVTTGC